MLNVTVNGKKLLVNDGVQLSEIAKMIDAPHPFLVAKIGHEIRELHRNVTKDCEIDFLDVTSDNGYRVYQRTAVFVMIKAAREVLGKEIRVVVEHSINKNYYCEIMEEGLILTPEILAQIKAKMEEIVAEDIEIVKESFLLEDGIKVAKNMQLQDKMQLLAYRTSSSVNFYRLGWFYDYFYGPMATRAGVLTKFDLLLQEDGFILVFPNQQNPDELSELISVSKLTQVFHESNNWARILKIDTVGALNGKICQGESGEIIRVTEALHEKSVAKMADEIHQKGRNVVLIAGPSSSGKTTFAQRLSVQLRVNGLKPHVISLDDYYVDRDKTPLDKFGVPNFESLYSIDVPKFNEDLQELLSGGKVHLPKYNFLTGKREYKGHFLQLSDDAVLVIEGIHGLNPELSRKVPDEAKFKIFISALTQLNMDDHNRIPAADTRMIRRIVRDSQFRGFDARRTLELWPAVVRGESENIFPFQDEADVIFNSALIYELCVLKPYVMPQLFAIQKDQPEFMEARRLLKFLDSFMVIVEKEVPNNSLLREFIGGGCFRT
ncbi:MAG: nucleoside kinase [Defluviitaleaceae bacterium]|nr:nucleoside kinase [Defluviitaleaceae bacterium]